MKTARTSDPSVKVNLTPKSDLVNLVAPASPIKRLLYLLNVRVIQFKLGPERLTRLRNSNVLRPPVTVLERREGGEKRRKEIKGKIHLKLRKKGKEKEKENSTCKEEKREEKRRAERNENDCI